MDLDDLIKQARRRDLLTTKEIEEREGQETTRAAEGGQNAQNEARESLEPIWLAVAQAMRMKNPPPDVMIVDEQGERELHDLWRRNFKPYTHERKKKRVNQTAGGNCRPPRDAGLGNDGLDHARMAARGARR